MSKLREVEVTVMLPENVVAVEIARAILDSLRILPASTAINVKICAIEEEAEEPKVLYPMYPMWCVECGGLMVREEYDEKHDRYRCPGCDKLVEVEKGEA